MAYLTHCMATSVSLTWLNPDRLLRSPVRLGFVVRPTAIVRALGPLLPRAGKCLGEVVSLHIAVGMSVLPLAWVVLWYVAAQALCPTHPLVSFACPAPQAVSPDLHC